MMNEENVIQKIEKYKSRVERKIARNKKRIKEYEDNKSNLSEHGHWSLGYYIGITSELENLLDDINDLLENNSKSE